MHVLPNIRTLQRIYFPTQISPTSISIQSTFSLLPAGQEKSRYTKCKFISVSKLLNMRVPAACVLEKTHQILHYDKKCTLVQALRLCTGRTAHKGSRAIALLFHDHGTRRWWGVSVTPQPLFTPGKDPVPIVQEAGWAPGPVWTGAENLAPTGILSPDSPGRSQS
jgi:hypothetical protein